MQKNNKNFKLPPANELHDLIRRHGIENQYVRGLLLSYATNPDQAGLKDLWEAVMPRILYNRMFSSPYAKPSPEVSGELEFAVTETGLPVGLNTSEVHSLIAGASNSGKSVLLGILSGEAIKKGNKVWMFVKTDDSTRIIRTHPDILYVDFTGSFRFNPIFCLSKEIFLTIFKDAFVLYEGSEGYLMGVMKELESQNKNFNLYDLNNFISSKKHSALSRTQRYRESIENRLADIINSPLGNTFDCLQGHEEDIVKNSVIFNIAKLTLPLQKFIVNTLITFLYFHNME